MNENRTEKGQFAEGNKGGPGRPAKAREAAYLAVLRETVSLEDWKEIVESAKADAKHGVDGKTRETGRRFIADYCIGKPKQSISVDRGGGYNEFADLSDQELDAIIAEADTGPGAGNPGGEEAGES